MPDGTITNPFTTANQMTLQTVLEEVSADLDLPEQRRRNICSALRTLAKVIGKSLAYLPAHPGYYRSFFKGLHPEHCGLTLGRIRNIKSDILFAFRRVGCIGGRHTYMTPLSPAWQALWDEAECADGLRRYVSRLMHYCSAQGIEPGDVDDAVSEQLREALVEESFVQDPIHTHKGIVRTWNKLADAVPSWPQSKLTVPWDKETYTIPLARLPKSFRDEVDALVEHWSGKDILDDTGPAKPLMPRTIKSRLYRLRQLVSALVLGGWRIEDIASLSQVVEVDAAKKVLRFYLNRAGGRTTSQVHSLAVLMKTLARHWVGVDDEHLSSLKDLCGRVDPRNKGMTDKNRDRLRQFDDPKNVALLLNFPRTRVDQILRSDRGLRGDAVTLQLALAVELLLMAPIRAENLVGIDIDRHIQRSRTGKTGVVHLVIPGAEVKNQQDLEFELPPETVELLDLYLRDFHPRLVSGSCSWLFPGKANKHKSRELFGDQVSKAVFKATGLRTNLHLFRHIAAKLYLDRNPGGYEVVRRLLGHCSMETTVRFYASMENAAAGRHFDDVILNLRQSGPKSNEGESEDE
ncbi:MAG: site-specific integrase [Rhodospirillaceae bacterium]|nr:site-specific integrase [Rhodospirillaceae bacterium]